MNCYFQKDKVTFVTSFIMFFHHNESTICLLSFLIIRSADCRLHGLIIIIGKRNFFKSCIRSVEVYHLRAKYDKWRVLNLNTLRSFLLSTLKQAIQSRIIQTHMACKTRPAKITTNVGGCLWQYISHFETKKCLG